MSGDAGGVPPGSPDTGEADRVEIDLARPQDVAYDRALGHTVNWVAHGGGTGDGCFVPAAGVTATRSAANWCKAGPFELLARL